MKNLSFPLLLAAFVLGPAANAHAGIKEGNGDSSLVFHCKSFGKSLANTDSRIEILDSLANSGRGIQLKLTVADQSAGSDSGSLSADQLLYQGQIFDIQFGQPSRLTAKAPTAFMNAGASEALDCEFTGP